MMFKGEHLRVSHKSTQHVLCGQLILLCVLFMAAQQSYISFPVSLQWGPVSSPCDSVAVSSPRCFKVIPSTCRINNEDYYLQRVTDSSPLVSALSLAYWTEVEDGVAFTFNRALNRITGFELTAVLISAEAQPLKVCCYYQGRLVDSFIAEVSNNE